MDCGHVFCVQCLQDFYNDAIEKGELAAVRCLAPGCARDREKASTAQATGGKKRKKVKTFISPSELLQIPLDQEKVKRYVSLKYKTELESDKNTIYCPRQWCNGAARSKKHRKPQGLELCEVSEDEEDENEGEDKEGESTSKPYRAEDRLAICEECSYAFCSRCGQSWHGEFVRCMARRDKEELTAEEKASLEYMKLHTTPCPTCAAPAQKTQGCNHMICGRCQTHFCYLCSAWLDPGNPYQHFNEMPGGRVTSCYMRLWELEDGDGNDVGIGFAGGRGQRARPAEVQVPIMVEEPEDINVVGDAPAVLAAQVAPDRAGQEGRPPGDAPRPAQVAREGPLVLRIDGGNAPAGPGRGGPRGRAGNAQAAAVGRGQNNHQPNPPPQGGGRGRGRGAVQQQGRGAPRGGGGPARGGGARFAQRGQARGAGRGQRQLVDVLPGAQLPPEPNVNNNNIRGVHQAQAQVQAPAGQQQHQQQRHRNNNNNNEEQLRGAGDAWAVDLEAGNGDEGGLNAAQQAWIRQFVQLAMDDEEDEMLDDEDEDEGWGPLLDFH